MAQLLVDDSEIDHAVWSLVEESQHVDDLESYLNLFASPLHDSRACAAIDKILHNSITPIENSKLPEVISLLESWAAQNNPKANFYLGKFLRQNQSYSDGWSTSFKVYSLAGLNGDSRAYHNIAVAYQNGWGPELDLHKAFEYYEKAYQAFPDSLTTWALARMYIHGSGVERDIQKGISLLMTEIEAGDYHLQALWGSMLRNGDGIPVNREEGWQHLLNACEHGDE